MCSQIYIDIINLICNSVLAMTSLSALILGLFYFNKRLKFYSFVDNSKLKIIAFDKGNGSCKISAAFYCFKNKQTEIKNIGQNQIIINLAIVGDIKTLSITIFDNYGRKYKVKYKRAQK